MINNPVSAVNIIVKVLLVSKPLICVVLPTTGTWNTILQSGTWAKISIPISLLLKITNWKHNLGYYAVTDTQKQDICSLQHDNAISNFSGISNNSKFA